MIFTSIPLATVGGVLLLWIRGMPFSVSAGVSIPIFFNGQRSKIRASKIAMAIMLKRESR
ncbi:MAG: hypothetical protein QMB82_02655 [Bacteroidales bacterium]